MAQLKIREMPQEERPREKLRGPRRGRPYGPGTDCDSSAHRQLSARTRWKWGVNS